MNKYHTYIEITPFFPTEASFRGPYVYDQVCALQRTGLFTEIRVLRPTTLLSKERHYEYRGIKVSYFPCLESPSYILNGIFDVVNRWLFRHWWRRNGYKASEVAAAHAHVSTLGIYPLEIKKMNNESIAVLQHHDLDPYTIRNGKWANKKWNLLYRAARNIKLFGKIDCHVCVSEKVKASLLAFPQPRIGECYDSYLSKLAVAEELPKAFIRKTIVLYNGVDTHKFHQIHKSATPIFKIGCIANFVELKGHDTLLKAFKVLVLDKKMTDLRLSLIGSGPLLNVCKSYVAEHELEEFVTFEQEVQHHLLCRYYNSLNLFVLPSFFEGFGCVFTEAAACGVPFMTCENQGVEDYIAKEERSKWLFPVNDHLQLAHLIEQYRKSPSPQQLAYSWNIDDLIAGYLHKLSIR